jgi:protein gp37
MGENTKIAWTDAACNFWFGCFKVSPGCQHCYAETLSKRYGRDIWGPAKTTERWRTKSPWKDIWTWNAEAWKANTRRRVFVMSMGDFFEDHPQVEPWREEACEILAKLPWLDIQILTKRPENIARMVPAWWLLDWPKNIWIGTSVENQEMADKRAPIFFRHPAAVRFLSVEPMLEPIDLFPALAYIEWVIVGGESGAKHRPLKIEWIESIVSQCKSAGVPVFVKQDSGMYPGKQGRIPDELFIQEFPK